MKNYVRVEQQRVEENGLAQSSVLDNHVSSGHKRGTDTIVTLFRDDLRGIPSSRRVQIYSLGIFALRL
jgi:hypothetical protein